MTAANRRLIAAQTAQETLKLERDTIDQLIAAINDDFLDVVEHILDNPGRVVVTGIGKSAIVAQKIAATLNSTGTPSLFMHAADAVHGDLGMITHTDTVICISKSGNTPEIKVLLPLLVQRCSLLVGMTADVQSYLGQAAHKTLFTPVAREADPNNLAPTSSTTAQMVLGDALATALIANRGFRPTDFAQFHPGGVLGKQLYLRVADLLTNKSKPRVLPETSIADLIYEITRHRMGATAVVNAAGQLEGIITDGDVRRAIVNTPNVHQLTAAQMMTKRPVTVFDSALAVSALELMRAHAINQLIVLNSDDRYVGMVHMHDLLNEGII